MNFFDYIKNESFFKPLILKYKKVYYDCIQLLIDKTKELPVLYESDARDSITIYLKNLHIQESEKTEEISSELQPSKILGLYRECGWVHPREIGRNGEYIVNISTDCRKVMDFLRKMTEKSGEGEMANHISSMYEIMKSAFEKESTRKERPYNGILRPLIDNETELKNELVDLKDNISNIMKAVITFQDINSFGQFIMKDEMLDRFFGEYFFVKNNGLIPTQLSFIKNKLRLLRRGEIRQKMTEECCERLQISMEEAKERVEQSFSELQYFLSVEYEENMELIDKRINNYYNLANTRIMLMASNGIRLESLINDFLNIVSKMTETEQEIAMEKVGDCTRIINQNYVGYKSFEKMKRIKNEGKNIGISLAELSEEEKQIKTENLFKAAANQYSVERVESFLDVQLGDDKKMSVKEKIIKNKEEVLMYAAAMLYSKNKEFPYHISISDEMIQTDIADINNLIIAKK